MSLSMTNSMLITKRKPASVEEVLSEEFLEPLNLKQTELAKAMGIPCNLINELCRNRRAITEQTNPTIVEPLAMPATARGQPNRISRASTRQSAKRAKHLGARSRAPEDPCPETGLRLGARKIDGSLLGHLKRSDGSRVSVQHEAFNMLGSR